MLATPFRQGKNHYLVEKDEKSPTWHLVYFVQLLHFNKPDPCSCKLFLAPLGGNPPTVWGGFLPPKTSEFSGITTPLFPSKACEKSPSLFQNDLVDNIEGRNRPKDHTLGILDKKVVNLELAHLV